MSFGRVATLLCLAALPMAAATVDVAGWSSAVLHTGDTLEFTVSASGYSAHALDWGAPSLPARISFLFATLPLDGAWTMTAELRSRDGATALPFPSVAASLGTIQSATYRGSLSALSGSLALSPEASARVFAGPAVLALRNAGRDITVGIPGRSLSQDITVTLSGGSLAVGAAILTAKLDEAPLNLSPLADVSPDASGQAVPEPQSGTLLAVGVLLMAAALALKRPRSGAGDLTVSAFNYLFAILFPSLIPSRWQIGILPLKYRQSNQRSQEIN